MEEQLVSNDDLKSYSYDDKKKMVYRIQNIKRRKYYIKLFIAYFIHWNIVIYNLEKFI